MNKHQNRGKEFSLARKFIMPALLLFAVLVSSANIIAQEMDKDMKMDKKQMKSNSLPLAPVYRIVRNAMKQKGITCVEKKCVEYIREYIIANTYTAVLEICDLVLLSKKKTMTEAHAKKYTQLKR